MNSMTAVKDRTDAASLSTVALLDVNLLARRLGVSERFIRRLVDERRVPFFKIGNSCVSTPPRLMGGSKDTECACRGRRCPTVHHDSVDDCGRRLAFDIDDVAPVSGESCSTDAKWAPIACAISRSRDSAAFKYRSDASLDA